MLWIVRPPAALRLRACEGPWAGRTSGGKPVNSRKKPLLSTYNVERDRARTLDDDDGGEPGPMSLAPSSRQA